MEKKKNSLFYYVAFDAIKCRATLYRAEAEKHKCSMGKFLADLVVEVMYSVYVPQYEDEVIERKNIQLDPLRNLEAIVRDSDPANGNKFAIRPELLDYFLDLKNHAYTCISDTRLSQSEILAISKVLELLDMYEKGQLYAHEVYDRIVKDYTIEGSIS